MVSLNTGMSISMKMVTPVGQFQDKLMRAMHKELVKKFSSTAFKNSIRRGVKPILEAALMAQPEYLSMVTQDGRLRAELGVADSESAINSLVRAWVRSTHVDISRPRIVGNRILGTVVVVRAIQADYNDVLNQSYANYTTEKGQNIPWLEWLLTKGSDIFITSHRVWNPMIPTARSRTGTNTIMKKTKGAGWGVPPEFSGIPDNNYATRAVVDAMPEIGQLLVKETKRRF